jgi:hypothetical protein
MSSKNNPEMRGEVTELRKYNGKTVKPTRIIDPSNRINFIGACFENATRRAARFPTSRFTAKPRRGP